MSVIDLLTRVDAICQKYDKYDVEKQRDLNVSGDDAFARLYATVEADIEAALQVCPRSLSQFLSFYFLCCWIGESRLLVACYFSDVGLIQWITCGLE